MKASGEFSLAAPDFSERLQADGFFEAQASKLSAKAVRVKAPTMSSVDMVFFPSGSIKVTGFKSHVELLFVLEKLLVVIRDTHTMEELRVAMVNMTVAVPSGVNLIAFQKAVRARGGYAEMPERPPSCTVKLEAEDKKTNITGMIYSTGSFIVSAPRLCDIPVMYRYVFDILVHDDGTAVRLPKKSKQKSQGVKCSPADIMLHIPAAMHSHQPCNFIVPGCAYCKAFGNFFV